MNTDQPLVNRVANSGLVTIDLEKYFPKGERVRFDLKDYLFMELMLKEKDFRAAIQAHDWAQYEGKHLLVVCSRDAIIPMWAYMLVAASAEPYAASVFQGGEEEFVKANYQATLSAVNYAEYEGKRIIIKGCSNQPVPAQAYTYFTERLRPYAKSIMFGEPCSTVPVYKKPKG